jgi:hypothetical protein
MANLVPPRSRQTVAATFAVAAALAFGVYQRFGPDLTGSSSTRLASESLCGDHPCLDLKTGLVVYNNHLRHITEIWSLFEGLGQPGGEVFTPTANRCVLVALQVPQLNDNVQ